MNNTFWLNNPQVLLDLIHNDNDDNNNEYTFSDKLNIIFVLSLILSIIMVIATKGNISFMIFALIIGFLTIILHMQYVERMNNEFIMDKDKCIESTNNNPFMNPNILDSDSKGPCSFINDEQIDNNFYKNIFRDANDFYNKGLSMRQFYTIPGKTIPNDRDTLAKWLYDRKSCKEGNYKRCAKNINLDREDLYRVGGSRTS